MEPRIPAATLAETLAPALTRADAPHIWTPRFCDAGEHGAYIETDDIALWLSTTWGHAGRLYVSGHYPSSEDHQAGEQSARGYAEKRPEIHVTPTRTANAIAADIARRLLPGVRDLTLRTRHAIEQYEAKYRAREKAAEQLEAAGARRWRRQSTTEMRLHVGSLDLTVRYDGTDVEIKGSVPLALAVELARQTRRNAD